MKFEFSQHQSPSRKVDTSELNHLNRNHIYINSGHYLCQACGLRLANKKFAIEHSYLTFHRANLLIADVGITLFNVPPIIDAHRTALNKQLAEALNDVVLSSDQLNVRYKIADKLIEIIQSQIPDIESVYGIGSHWYHLAIESSPVRLNVVPKAQPVSPSPKAGPGRGYSDSTKSSGGLVLSLIYDHLEPLCTRPARQQLDCKKQKIDPIRDDADDGSGGGEEKVNDRLFDFRSVECVCNETFYLALHDCASKSDFFISIGSSSDHHLAVLIDTYLQLNDAARHLAILFRKLAHLASMDLPMNGTFTEDVLAILVIFYLQHSDPPLLPNLHHLFQLADASVDLDRVAHKVSIDSSNLSFLTDHDLIFKLWSQQTGRDQTQPPSVDLTDLWLGFLRFYLYRFKAMHCMIDIVSQNPVKYSQNSFIFGVLDPFDKRTNLCKYVSRAAYDFIRSQMLSTYGYFAIPRMSSTGRHLFTRICVSKNLDDSDVSRSHDDKDAAHKSKSAPKDCLVHFTPIIDDSNRFESNLMKITNLLTKQFESSLADSPVKSDRGSSADESVQDERFKTCPIEILFPHMLKFIMDEIVDEDDLKSLTNEYLKQPLAKLIAPLGPQGRLNLNQFSQLIEHMALSIWSSFYTNFISQGIYTGSKQRVLNMMTELIGRGVQNWLKLYPFLKSTLNNCSTRIEPQQACKSNSDDELDAIVLSASSHEDAPEPETLLKDIQLDFDNMYDGDMEDFVAVGDTSDDDDEVLTDQHDEWPLDLGDDDDDGGDGIAVVDSQDQVETSALDKASADCPQTVGADQTVSSPTLKKETQSDAGEKKERVLTKKERKIAARVAKNEAASKWSNFILPQSNEVAAVDDNRPDYYHSRLLADLGPSDFSFPFEFKLILCANRRFGTSVLGLSEQSKPSTMLAHLKPPQPVCEACGLTGHFQSKCQSAITISVSFGVWSKLAEKIPTSCDDRHLVALSAVLMGLAKQNETRHLVQPRLNLVQNLYNVLSADFPNIQLALFGSCANGFDLRTSDLDICVFFPPDSQEWNMLINGATAPKLMQRIKTCLLRNRNKTHIRRLLPILRARTPIFKVLFNNFFEADISFSNYLAILNTSMLKMYTLLEPKLRVLGIALKHVVKLTAVGITRFGGISSYACIVLLIHYLQQKSHLPVLQQLYEGPEQPVQLVVGWNAWYQKDMDTINRLWQRPSQPLSVAELWLGFFRYYLFEFDRSLYVVSIRQKQLLTRFSKMWNSLFAIEDPFNLNHNLTAFLTRSNCLNLLNAFHMVLIGHTTPIPKTISPEQWKRDLFVFPNARLKTNAFQNQLQCSVCLKRRCRCGMNNYVNVGTNNKLNVANTKKNDNCLRKVQPMPNLPVNCNNNKPKRNVNNKVANPAPPPPHDSSIPNLMAVNLPKQLSASSNSVNFFRPRLAQPMPRFQMSQSDLRFIHSIVPVQSTSLAGPVPRFVAPPPPQPYPCFSNSPMTTNYVSPGKPTNQNLTNNHCSKTTNQNAHNNKQQNKSANNRRRDRRNVEKTVGDANQSKCNSNKPIGEPQENQSSTEEPVNPTFQRLTDLLRQFIL